MTQRFNGRRLFGEDVTFNRLAELLDEGAQIRATPLTEAFDFEAYRQRYGTMQSPCLPWTIESSCKYSPANKRPCPNRAGGSSAR
ncbi:MAG: hypothetical protein R3F37_17560 [Candidatus Competibacteraceae bacterium]